MSTSTQIQEILDGLTARQRQVWEMTHGMGDYEGPMRADEIAKELGITPNAVYVTRRRVRAILEEKGLVEPGTRQPKRIIRQRSGLEEAIDSLETQLEGYETEVERLRTRLEQIERQKPELEEALGRLKAIAEPDKKGNPQPVAA